MGVLWVVLLFDVEQGQVEALKHAEQKCTSYRIYMCNNYYVRALHSLTYWLGAVSKKQLSLACVWHIWSLDFQS